MSLPENIDQVYGNNPITSNDPGDLIYIGRSPYGATDDAAILFSDFAAQFATPAQIQQQAFVSGNDSGVADAYIITLSPAITSYIDGMIVIMTSPLNPNVTNSPTLNINGLGDTPISNPNNQPMGIGDINPICPAIFQYNLSQTDFILINPQNIMTSTTSLYGGANGPFNFMQDMGAANAYLLQNNYIPQDSLLPVTGSVFYFTPSNSNTGASTLGLNGQAPSNFVNNDGSALSSGQLIVGSYYSVTYDGTNFILLNPSSVGDSVTPADIQNQAFTHAFDSGIANAYVMTLTPNVPSSSHGQTFLLFPSNANTGASTLDVGFGATEIYANGSALVGGELIDGLPYFLIFDSFNSKFNLINTSIGGITSSGIASGQVLIANSTSSAISSANFTWDNTKNSLAVGNSATTNGKTNAFGLGTNCNPQYNGCFIIGDGANSAAGGTQTNQFEASFTNGFLFKSAGFAVIEIDNQQNIITRSPTYDQDVFYQIPVTGFTITINGGASRYLLDPAGTLAAGTIILPGDASTIDGKIISFSSSQIITSLTIQANTGQSLANGMPTTITAGQGYSFIFKNSNSTWYRLY